MQRGESSMKKIGLFLLVVCLCLLSACEREQTVSGKVVEADIDDEIGVTSFIVRTWEEEDIGIVMTEETIPFLFPDGITADEFKAGALLGTKVSVECEGARGSLTTQGGQEVPAYHAKTIYLTAVLREETATLSDGTNLDIWQHSNSLVYTLENGTELLWITGTSGPNDVGVVGTEDFDDLSAEAQQNVMKFYEKQGLLYDILSELEKAYAGYRKEGMPLDFNSYSISQEISPTASNEHVMYFLTSVSLPVDGNRADETRIGASFDRKTGEVIPNEDLFSCAPEEAVEKILDIIGGTDPTLREEMRRAFEFQQITLFSDALELYFPQGTLPSEKYACIWGLDYNDKLREILYDWAVPTSRK